MKVTYLNNRLRRLELSKVKPHKLPLLIIGRSGASQTSPRNAAAIEAAHANGSTLVVLEPDDGEAA